ncbi:MAG: hypothetical protein ABI418_17250 [Jatrophihabitantaceae bacterium]
MIRSGCVIVPASSNSTIPIRQCSQDGHQWFPWLARPAEAGLGSAGVERRHRADNPSAGLAQVIAPECKVDLGLTQRIDASDRSITALDQALRIESAAERVD